MRSHILPGLPGEGPLPKQFSATGQGLFREGYVVEFNPPDANAWVGNFQSGGTQLYRVLEDLDGEAVLVIAGGQGYVVNERSGQLLAQYDRDINFVETHKQSNTLIVGSNKDFTAYRNNAVLWRTRRISWDGFRNLLVTGEEIQGEAWCFDNTWHKFSVNLSTGYLTGGSYYEPGV